MGNVSERQGEHRGLPIAGQPAERADAARNRRRVLAAAAAILAADGVEGLSVDAVARAAGVGVGTVYRRFGDRTGLMFALLSEREQEFQAAFMNGPPPLGPGAAPEDRLRAFLHALVDRIIGQHDLTLLAETGKPGSRFRSGPYSVYHTHVAALLSEARPSADIHYLADALLAPVSATLIHYQHHERDMSADAIKAGLDDLLAGR
jgi:AcrR family transcriptional regulator